MAKSASANRRNDENKINPGIKLTLIVVAILCVVMLVYSVCQSMGVLDRNTTAMTVGEDDISVTQLNQYYHTTRNGFLNQYGSYLSMYGYDLSSAAFDMQNCMFDSTKTWKEYFMEEAKAAAEEVSILYQEAQKAGYTMSEEDQKNYDSYLDALKNAAENNGYSVRKYVKALYGTGTKLSDVEAYYSKRVLASGYYQTVVEGFGIDDAAIDAYYDENSDDYDELHYYLFDIAYTTYTYSADSTEEGAPTSEEEAAQMTADSKAAAQADAEALLGKLNPNGSNFDAVAADYEGESEEAFTSALTETVVSEVDGETTIGAWLTNESRKAGDMEVLDDEDNSSMSVVLYLGRELSDDYTVAVRHILFKTETAADDADDAAKAEVEASNAALKEQAESVYAEWQAAGATEDSFAQYAKEYSADGNAEDGGLYTGVYEGQMTAAFNDWCFDESRKPGDHGIVETSFGYHIMYFVENEGLSYRGKIKSTLESDKYNEYLTGLKETINVTYNDKAISLM